MTLDDIVRIVRANAVMLFVAASIGMFVGFGAYLRTPVSYTSTASGVVLAGNPQSVTDAISASALQQRKARDYAALVRNAETGRLIVERLGLDVPPEQVAAALSAAVAEDSSVISISATASTPAEAKALADAAVQSAGEAAAALESRGLPEGSPVASLTRMVPLEPGTLPLRPASPVLATHLMAGAFGALLLGFTVAAVRRVLDRRVRTSRDVEDLTGNGVIGIIPFAQELRVPGQSGERTLGVAAESFRALRSNLQFIDVDSPPRSIVVTSANPGDGKSSVAANLARVLALAGEPTVLIDGDLRRPRIAEEFGLEDLVGLTQVLSGRVTLEEALQPVGDHGLQVLTAGRIPPNPSELVGSRRMKALIKHLAAHHTVIIDAPPLLPVIDAGVLAAHADGAITVLRVGRTEKDQVELCTRVFERLGAENFGFVLNAAPMRRMGEVLYGYGYGGYHQTGYEVAVPPQRDVDATDAGLDLHPARGESR